MKQTAFQINVNGKLEDYRKGAEIDLKAVKEYFAKKYTVTDLHAAERHVVGTLEKNNKEYFLKLSTTIGISALTKNEYQWNDQFNKQIGREDSNFWVPRNYDCGEYEGNLFYLITDKADGELLAPQPEKVNNPAKVLSSIEAVIGFSELIQTVILNTFPEFSSETHYSRFTDKSAQWLNAIPSEAIEEYQLSTLQDIVVQNAHLLVQKTRHGDFTPWHIFIQKDQKLMLIDGEHAIGQGVEYYDIAYFIERIWNISESSDTAREIIRNLEKRNYDLTKLQTVLASRAIGGFLDESLKPAPNYSIKNQFKDWVKTSFA